MPANSSERMRRLLAIIPWIVNNPGVEISEVADRFNIAVDELLEDLSVVYMIGLPPYTPDSLVDVDLSSDGKITIRLAEYFSRPMRLTPSQGLALLAASEAYKELNKSIEGDLKSALEKLSEVFGLQESESLEVDLGIFDRDIVSNLEKCIDEELQAEISYYSYGRDSESRRTVEPWQVIAKGGHWYFKAWCYQAKAERTFRIDRVKDLQIVDTPAKTRQTLKSRRPSKHGDVVFNSKWSDPRVTLRLPAEARWVSEIYPVDKISYNENGSVDVIIPVTAHSWFERLMIRLGDRTEILEAEGIDSYAIAADAAKRVLARYS